MNNILKLSQRKCKCLGNLHVFRPIHRRRHSKQIPSQLIIYLRRFTFTINYIFKKVYSLKRNTTETEMTNFKWHVPTICTQNNEIRKKKVLLRNLFTQGLGYRPKMICLSYANIPTRTSIVNGLKTHLPSTSLFISRRRITTRVIFKAYLWARGRASAGNRTRY